jgi:hypothetical protein
VLSTHTKHKTISDATKGDNAAKGFDDEQDLPPPGGMMTGDSDRHLISSLLSSEEEEKDEVQVETEPIDRPPATTTTTTTTTISSPRIMEEDDDDGSGDDDDEDDNDEGIVPAPPTRTPSTPTSSYYHLYAASNTPQSVAATNSEWTVQQSMQQRGHAAVTDDSDGTLRRGSHALTHSSNDNDAEESGNLVSPLRAVAGKSETTAATTSDASSRQSGNNSNDDEGGAGAGNMKHPSLSTRAASSNLSEASPSSEIGTTHRPGRSEGEGMASPKEAMLRTANSNPNASPPKNSTAATAPTTSTTTAGKSITTTGMSSTSSGRDQVRTSEAKKSKIFLRVILGAFMFGLFGTFVRITPELRECSTDWIRCWRASKLTSFDLFATFLVLPPPLPKTGVHGTPVRERVGGAH